MTDRTVLMSAEEIDRALSRIAHQLLEFAGGAGELALVGIHSRGVPLARRLAWKIAQAGEVAPPVGVLDINLYRDDVGTAVEHPLVRRTELPFRLDERQVVLVDDVLGTGRTIRSAMDALTDLGRPRAIRLAVLVDRGGRELPIQSDFVGRSFAVTAEQVVEVRLAELDGGTDRVTLRSKAAAHAERRGRDRYQGSVPVPPATAAAAKVKSRAKGKRTPPARKTGKGGRG